MPKRDRRHTQPVREKSEFDHAVLDVRRTARVVAGGRRFSFRALVAVGNRKGKVGVGIGKGLDVASAVEKAVFQGKKSAFEIPLTPVYSIPHEARAKFSAARVVLKPAREGRGLVTGGPVRPIADLAGIKNMTSKILGRTPNKLNNARAVIEALKKLR
ncbi:MAG: 30S ribosomal protein S5 [Candidatus Sungbacteria bacterium]|nr:30S ribosomal protein S5 [Candidatus Sungbacteria bacterium]